MTTSGFRSHRFFFANNETEVSCGWDTSYCYAVLENVNKSHALRKLQLAHGMCNINCTHYVCIINRI